MDPERSSSNRDSEDYELLSSTATETNDYLSHSPTVTDSIFRGLRQNFRGESQLLNDLSSDSTSQNCSSANLRNSVVNQQSTNSHDVQDDTQSTSASSDAPLGADNQSDLNVGDQNLSHSFDNYPISEDIEDFAGSSDEEEDFNNLSNHEDAFDKRRFAKLDDIILDEQYNTVEPLQIEVSKLDMILSIMKYAQKYHIPTTGIVDLFKMQNMFLNKVVFPENRYQVDSLFNPEGGIDYHAVCPVCNVYVGIFSKKQRTIFCEVCDVDINLKDPSYTNYFVIIDVVNKLRNLIEANSDYYIDVVTRRNKEPAISFKDFPDGQKYKKFVESLPVDHKESYISVTFNSDGSPTFKSSKNSIWPIQMVVNEVPENIRSLLSITCALWFGPDKPNMTYFLRPFVDYINKLNRNGIKCQLQNQMKYLHLYALCCCVDAVARAPMQGTVQFNGYYGCNWCLHPGVRVRHDTGYAMKYPILDEFPERRTANATIELLQRAVELNAPVLGIKNVSCLVVANGFDIIDGFVADPLHCIDKGVSCQLCNYWMASSGKPYSIPKNKLKEIDRYIKKFKVPTQLVRLSRSINERAYWNAAEWCNWTLFYSIPILKYLSRDIPEFEVYMNHWSLLVEAYYILLKNGSNVTELMRADVLLKEFVFNVQHLYGKDAMSFNVHQLLHLTQSVADWGPLYAHSGYVFESGNGKLKRTIYAAKGVLSQVCRHLSFEESIIILQKHVQTNEDSPCLKYVRYLENGYVQKTDKFSYRYFGRTLVNQDVVEQFELPLDSVRAYVKMVKDGCLFKTCERILYRSDNAFAILKNGSFIQIQQFLVNIKDGKEYTTYRKIEVSDDPISYELNCMKQVVEISCNIDITETDNIDKLCVYLSVDCNDYISSVPNMLWK